MTKNFSEQSMEARNPFQKTHQDRIQDLEKIFCKEGPIAQYFGDTYQYRPGQVTLSKKCLLSGEASMHMVAEAPTGCHAAGQLILMADETCKRVEDIQVGDCLMEPDYTLCEVFRLIRGTGEMVKIIPTEKGWAPWTVNKDHILTLVHFDNNSHCDVSVAEWITWPAAKKSCWSLFKVIRHKTPYHYHSFPTSDFTIEEVGPGQYYGFTISGSGRYLLEDRTVTHNSGKSFAYSIPGVMLIQDPSVPHIKRMIIATANIALQEQLYYKDLPLLQSILYPDLSFGLLKGKNNYLCMQKYDEAEESLFRDDDLDYLRGWVKETETGDKSDLQQPIKKWHLFSSNSQECLGSKCSRRADCFAVSAQNRAKRAEVIITNFHMLLASGGGLPSHQILVCDEGHEIASVARHALGFTITRGNLDWVKRQLDAYSESQAALKLDDALLAFENFYFNFIGQKKAANKRIEYADDIPDLEPLIAYIDLLQSKISKEKNAFAAEGNEEEEGKKERDLKRASNLLTNLKLLQKLDPSHVFWVEKKTRKVDGEVIKERKQRGKRHTTEWIQIESRPIDVSGYLRAMFFSPKTTEEEGEDDEKPMPYSATLVSATMTTNDGFDFIREETGLDKSLGIEISVPSPFNLKEQGVLIVPQTMVAQPRYNGGEDESKAYYDALAEHLTTFTNKCAGRVLALFTSWYAMAETLKRCRKVLHIPILSQDEGERTKLVEAFRKKESGLLAGVSSFWTGVDIPGMQGLFIDKLPFPVPSDPLFAAMSDMYEVRGKKPFFDLSLPLATLKLRQGIGRLIRTANDTGAVMLADRRLIDKGYGQTVIDALPDFRFIVNMDLL